MSYLVFALKWRPRNFEEVVFQDQITTTLKNSILKKRLAFAYLFAGPRGVGKTSTARIFAKSLNCKEGVTAKPCQKCSSCNEIDKARNLDVIEIDGASNRGIDEIRALRENVKFAPVGGRFKVYIIDEVHMLTMEAFNALLKTLEEPPEFVKFIFATTQPNKIPATILSRCQRFDFKRIPLLKIIEQLNKIIAQEKIKIDKDVVFSIARASDGSLRDAEALLDQLISFSKDKISLNDIISVLGVVQQEVLFDITDKIAQKDSKAALEILNNVVDSGKDIGLFLNNLIEHCRNLMISKVAAQNSALIDLPQDICERLSSQARLFSLEEILSFFNILVNTQEMGRRFESLRIPLEISLIRLAHSKAKSSDAPVARQKDVQPEKKEEELPLEESDVDPEADDESRGEVKQGVSLEDIKEKWNEIVQALSTVKMSVATYLNEGTPLKIESNRLTVAFPKNLSLHKEALERKEDKLLVEKTISDSLGAGIKLNYILSKDAVLKEKSDSPELRSILDTFNARTIRES